MKITQSQHMPDYRRLDRAIWRKNWIESAEIRRRSVRNAKFKIKTKQKSTEKGYKTVEGTTSATAKWEELRAQSRAHSKICVFLMESWTLKKFQQIFCVQINGFS